MIQDIEMTVTYHSEDLVSGLDGLIKTDVT